MGEGKVRLHDWKPMEQFHIRNNDTSLEIYVEDAGGHHAGIEVSKKDFYKELNRIRISLEQFEAIDTSLVENDSDELLLKKCRGIQMDGQWGLIAELLKRFKSHIHSPKG